jgi:hypothetical protein
MIEGENKESVQEGRDFSLKYCQIDSKGEECAILFKIILK